MGSLYLVDDHVMFREALCLALTARGHEILGESDDPTTALHDMQRLKPQVVLLDLYLGCKSGFELLAEIHRRRLLTRVIVLTMAANSQQVAEALRLGAHGYVLKGDSIEKLHEAVIKCLLGQRHFDGTVADLMAHAIATPDDQALASLSVRERQVMLMVVRGRSSAEIGHELHLSPKTVDSYRSRLMSKLGVKDVTGLVRYAIRSRVIHPDEA